MKERWSRQARGAAAVSPHVRLYAAILVATALLLLVNPIGYRAGGGDDVHYLDAARCAARALFCLPSDHWASRWPLVVPTGLAIRGLGESRAVLMLVPLLCGLAALLLLVRMVERRFGRPAALFAGLLFVATPSVAGAFTELNVDVVELAWMIAALFCFDTAVLRVAHGGSGRRLAAVSACASRLRCRAARARSCRSGSRCSASASWHRTCGA